MIIRREFVDESVKTEEVIKKKKFETFNNGLAYYLKNIRRFIWTVVKFVIIIAGILAVAFPFVIVALLFVSPESAVKAVKALSEILEIMINLFLNVK
jgi:cytoskeletal protein RodZ